MSTFRAGTRQHISSLALEKLVRDACEDVPHNCRGFVLDIAWRTDIVRQSMEEGATRAKAAITSNIETHMQDWDTRHHNNYVRRRKRLGNGNGELRSLYFDVLVCRVSVVDRPGGNKPDTPLSERDIKLCVPWLPQRCSVAEPLQLVAEPPRLPLRPRSSPRFCCLRRRAIDHGGPCVMLTLGSLLEC